MTLNELYQLAESESVGVDNFRLNCVKSLSQMDVDGDCHIALDDSQIGTAAEEKIMLGHELGHCLTGSFYNRYSPLGLRQKHEHRANKKAVYTLMPLNELMEAFESPWNGMYDIAEHFGATEDFAYKAIGIYEADIREMMMKG